MFSVAKERVMTAVRLTSLIIFHLSLMTGYLT